MRTPQAQHPKWKPLLLHIAHRQIRNLLLLSEPCVTFKLTQDVICPFVVTRKCKFLYRVGYEKYNMHQLMFSSPVHYGMWQPYKCWAFLMWRKFCPLQNCLLRYDLKVGGKVLFHCKLVCVERIFGALLLAGQSVRGADTIVSKLNAIQAPTKSSRVAVNKMMGLQTLLYTYGPSWVMVCALVPGMESNTTQGVY